MDFEGVKESPLPHINNRVKGAIFLQNNGHNSIVASLIDNDMDVVIVYPLEWNQPIYIISKLVGN